MLVYILTHLILTTKLQGGVRLWFYDYSDEGTKALKGSVTCSMSHSQPISDRRSHQVAVSLDQY